MITFRLVGPLALASLVSLDAGAAMAQATTPVPVRAVVPPARPIPPEAATAGIQRFSFIAYGDTRGRRDGVDLQHEHSLVVESMRRTITALERTPYPVRFVLQSGDAVVNGRDPAQWNESYVELINQLTRDAGVPYFLAAGNHDVTGSADVASPGRREGLGNYLQAMGQLIPPDGATRRLAGYPTYAIGFGNTFVLAIDSNIAADSTQLLWVEAQLAGLDRRRFTNVVAMFHHPLYSSGPHGGPTLERPTVQMRQFYAPLFRKHDVRLLVTGHEHLYEHWVERYRGADGSARRMDQIVTGGGGAPLYLYQGEPDLREYIRADTARHVRVEHLVKPGMEPGSNPYHYVIVRVDGPRMEVDVVGVDWGRGYAPYRSTRATMADTVTARPPRE